MRALVSDTGPLNYLIVIEAAWILPRLFVCSDSRRGQGRALASAGACSRARMDRTLLTSPKLTRKLRRAWLSRT